MKVWLFQLGETLPLKAETRRLRTYLLADELARRGHSVLWWASTFDHLRKEWVFDKDTEFTVYDGLKITALKGIAYKKNFSLARFIGHRVIASKFRKVSRVIEPPDIIVSAMPAYDLAFEATIYAKEKDIPILIDIRDQWPENFLDRVPGSLRGIARLALYNEFSMLKKLLRMADGIISMTDVLLEWGLEHAGRQRRWKDKVFHLGYSKGDCNDNDSDNKIHALKEKLKGKFIITFIGTFAMYHNPSILIDCARAINDEGILFVLAGDGELLEGLKKQASNLKNILFTGWLNQYEISTLLEISHIGVCPTGGINTNAFFPNKAFMYWSVGLPILSSFRGEIENVIENFKVGYTYSDSRSLIQSIRNLREDTILYREMSSNAKTLFIEKFEAGKIYAAYAKHIEDVAAEFYSNRK